MAWRRPGTKPLSEPVMVSLLMHICITWPQWVNSLAPGRCGNNFKRVIFKLTSRIWLFSNQYEIALGRMPLDPTDDKSKLVQVMAWCLTACTKPLPEILVISDWWLRHLLWNFPNMNVTDFADDQSTLVQVMAWCHQATSHYLSQCWPRSLSQYGVTRPQWVNKLFPNESIIINPKLY